MGETGQGQLSSPNTGRTSTLSLHPVSGGAHPRSLADGDCEAIRSEELWRGHSHAPLLCLPTVFLDLLWEGPGSAQAMAPQTHRDTDANRPTQRDTSGTPGGKGTPSQSPQDPHRASEVDHTHPQPVPRLSLQGEATTQGLRVRQVVPTQSVVPAPGTAHSPGTCVVRPGSSCEGQLSSGPAQHPYLPACSSGTGPREAPAEGRGPKALSAGPIPYQGPNFPTQADSYYPRNKPQTKSNSHKSRWHIEGPKLPSH